MGSPAVRQKPQREWSILEPKQLLVYAQIPLYDRRRKSPLLLGKGSCLLQFTSSNSYSAVRCLDHFGAQTSIWHHQYCIATCTMSRNYSSSPNNPSYSSSARVSRRAPTFAERITLPKRITVKPYNYADRYPILPSLRHRSRLTSDGPDPRPPPLNQSALLTIDGSLDDRRRSSSGSRGRRASSRPARQSQTLDTVIEVPSTSSSRRPTVTQVSQSQPELSTRKPRDISAREDSHVRRASLGSDMHQAVKSEDYLLARGANPRTGVVTPAHSAGNSLEECVPAVPEQPARWRQRGDQWISLDQGEPTPTPSIADIRAAELRPAKLRTPKRLSAGKPRDSSLGTSDDIDYETVASSQSVQHGNSQPPGFGIGAWPTTESSAKQGSPVTFDAPVKRKPVGSPPSRSPVGTTHHHKDISDESTTTVVRKPKASTNQHMSSAPIHPGLYPPKFDKDLPQAPRDSSVASDHNDRYPFLGSREAGNPTKDLPLTLPPIPEKELPCLPTSNGPSLSKAKVLPYPVSLESPSRPVGKFHSPREGGDPAYPYIWTAVPEYSIPSAISHCHPSGGRPMPYIVYDNPPKDPLRLAGPISEPLDGPRDTPHRTRLPQRPPGLLSNITSTRTTMYMRGPEVPRLAQMGPRPVRPDSWKQHCGPPGMGPRPPPLRRSDIIMSTNMNMDTNSLMDVPMPRMRPQAMTRPQMPTPAEGMCGIPKLNRDRYDPRRITMPRREKPHVKFADTTDPQRNQSGTDSAPHIEKSSRAVEATQDPGLTGKCSRCIQGVVDVRSHNTDSVTRTSDLQKGNDVAEEGCKQVHPLSSPLPKVPYSDTVSSKQGYEKEDVDERDHTICCPRCCRMDCHEGCLGHPIPTASPIRESWSDTNSLSSSSTLISSAKAEEVIKLPGVFPRESTTMSKKDQESKASNYIHSALSKPKTPVKIAVQPPTPIRTVTPVRPTPNANAVTAANSAVTNTPSAPKPSLTLPAALSIAFSPRAKTPTTRPIIHKRQRSNSLPTIGLGISTCKASGQSGYRPFSNDSSKTNSKIRIPSPWAGGWRSCSAGIQSVRNVSGSSIEIPLPTITNYTTLFDMILVPIDATRMWINNHPQVLLLGGHLTRKATEMAGVITKTTWQVWAIAFVYSKTGKIKFSARRGETVGGFAWDAGRSFLYAMVFLGIAACVLRMVGLILGVVRFGWWFSGGLFWVCKGILGLGGGGR
jgi:hypothetical protein